MAATFKRTGLHRAECEHGCGAYLYATVAMLERHGCPVCSCGGRFVPDHPDLAATVMPDVMDVHPAVQAYRAELSRVLHGQASHGLRGRQLRPAEEIAAERVARDLTRRARERQLSGLRRGNGAAATVDVIPF